MCPSIVIWRKHCAFFLHAHRHKHRKAAMGKTTQANVQPQSRNRPERLLLLERICKAKGKNVRHLLDIPEDLSADALAREIIEYQEAEWRAFILWRGCQHERWKASWRAWRRMFNRYNTAGVYFMGENAQER